MKGSVRKRGKKWYYYFDLGIVDGKRKRVERVGGNTKKEAEKAMREALSEFDDTGQVIDESTMSYSDYLDYWYENYVELNCKESTQKIYKNRINKHIRLGLGFNKLNSLTPALLQEFFNNLYKQDYSKNSFKGTSAIVKNSLDYAVNPLKLIKDNPYNYVIKPKFKNIKKEIQTITKEQFNILLKRFPKGNLYHIPLQIAYYTGMRRGEVCALTWDDIDFNKKTIDVNKTMIINLKSEYELIEPKTQSSYRIISIGDNLVKILREHKIYQKEMKLKLGEYYIDKDYPVPNMVCTSDNGTFTKHTTLSTSMCIVAEKNLGFAFNFHMLRHTHASILIQSGVNPKDVQYRLGHSNISITLDTYTHTSEESRRKVADIFDKL
ncbi:tyrosine-type recombinase/integrase [Metaclostridioides mangenotii]|uniref:tyrosine-type recombinase/integrase n=1 Tax=Metaclostridioides mangenotii TaxID=1540 RepID=UPI0004651241|nr:tyrosine-type recombinase/integrase [Clostridioides mangenotii]